MTKNSPKKTLVVITGPTAVGKTSLSLDIAASLDTEIVSADARQFYRELVIGTAAPTARELAQVPHHLVGNLSIHDYYNASMFEQQALGILHDIFRETDYAVLTGGSGLYIDALCQGIDILPEIDGAIRNQVKQYFKDNGLDALRTWLRNVDPEFYHQVDLANPNRIMRGIEVFLMTGQRFSALRTRQVAQRPFDVKMVILNRDRQELYQRINLRVDEMLQQGLVEEVITFFNQRHLNALNTVGYKEIFAWLSGQWPLHLALEKMKTNTRRYAKRQLTWFRRYEEAQWFAPEQKSQILEYIRS